LPIVLVQHTNILYHHFMSGQPFRDTAKRIADAGRDYISMSVESDRARSHGWWRNVIEYGPWKGPGSTRVGPPDPEALPGIAKLFGTTPDQVAVMIAADWYGVYPDSEVSPRALQLSPILDSLDDEDAKIVEHLARRLARTGTA